MNVKEFSQELYDADDQAKHLVIAYITQQWGFTNVRVNPNKYGIDLLALEAGRPVGIEVEVKHNWTGYPFPYENVHISARKTKFVGEQPETYFVMVSHDWSRMIACGAEAFDGAALVLKDTFLTHKELFIEIPLHRFEHYTLI